MISGDADSLELTDGEPRVTDCDCCVLSDADGKEPTDNESQLTDADC